MLSCSASRGRFLVVVPQFGGDKKVVADIPALASAFPTPSSFFVGGGGINGPIADFQQCFMNGGTTSSLPAFHTPSPNWGITLPNPAA